MRITILYGNPLQENKDFQFYLDNLKEKFEENNLVDFFHLDEMDLRYCSGCWSCWWKTPGKCIFKDDADKIFKNN